MHFTIPVKAYPNRNRYEKEELKRKTKRRKDLTWHSVNIKNGYRHLKSSVGRSVPLD
jgi:hypothetical protein